MLLDFTDYMPEFWIEGGVSIYEQPSAPARHKQVRNHDWIVNLAAGSFLGISLAVTSLPVHADVGASTLTAPIVLPKDVATEQDRIGQLQSALRSRNVVASAPDLLERARRIAAKPRQVVDIQSWADRLIRDVSDVWD